MALGGDTVYCVCFGGAGGCCCFICNLEPYWNALTSVMDRVVLDEI